MPAFPPVTPGQRVGLLGGSFDPPHTGHVHITQEALRRFELDWVWWLVSPGNPLKEDAPADLSRRMAASKALIQNPKVRVTALEHHLNTRYTADTLPRLVRRYPGVRFVWLMGADNLAGFHTWGAWQSIARTMPLGVLARPGEQIRAGLSPAARSLARFRLPQSQAGALAYKTAPRWCLITGRMVDQSSSELRNRGVWQR
ncbi:MAG: nicotinate-nucleotide adenylyltransferase [Pseudomonadota bacterium]